MSLIRSGHRVYPVIRVLPDDGIFGLLMKVDIIQEHPKSEKLRDVLGGDVVWWLDLENPCVMLEGLPHLPILPCRGFVYEWRDVLGLTAKKLRRVPERLPCAVSNDDGGRGIEKLVVNLGARIAKTHPQLVGLRPLIPKPAKAQSTCELVGIEDS